MNMNKTSFNDIGFLSGECLTTPALQQISSSDCYKFCENLNRAAQTVLNHIVIHPDDRKEVYAMLYFQRMLSHYQAALILARRGMIHQVEIILRTLLETLFDLAAFHHHHEFFDVLILGDSNERLAFLKALREQQETLDTYSDEEIEELEKIIASSEDVDRKDFKVFIKADLAGMLNEYRTLYALLGESTHSTVHSLEADLIINPTTDAIEGIKAYDIKTDGIHSLLMSTANYMLIGLNMILQIVPSIKAKADIEILNNKIQDEWLNVVAEVSHR